MSWIGHLVHATISPCPEGGRTWWRPAAFCLVALALVAGTGTSVRPEDPKPTAGRSATPLAPAGFPYDPQSEEGPHPESDFEWWYHFGFLKRQGTSNYEYSFVSSFQRNKSGRYLFYNLADLGSGEKSHHALVDRSLLGLTPRPRTSQGSHDGQEPASERSGIARRMAYWLQDALPLLPDGHQFFPSSNVPWTSSKSELCLLYGDNRLQKQTRGYKAVYRNSDFILELMLHAVAPPMPMLGTGLTGLEKPEDQHYYSYPRMSATGSLRRGGEQWEVEGDLWYDHQWGNVVSSVPKTWGWWGLRLRDGRNLAVFFLRDGHSGAIIQKGLTLHHPDGRTEVDREVEFQPLRYWNSLHGRRYAIAWRIEAQGMNMSIHVRPKSDDHELPVLLYGRIWEGPCLAEITVPGKPTVRASGFQELIGEADER